jgi:uncharacterized protein YigA (DUF484 family)
MAEPDSAAKINPVGVSAAEVADYLRQHPDFLSENPDLLSVLTPPALRRDGVVVDMQRYILDRLRSEVAKLRASRDEIIATSRANISSQTRIHTAALSLIGATTLEHVIEVITTDLAVHLEVDAIVLAFEALDRVPPGGNSTHLRLLPRGTIDRLMAGGRDVLMTEDQPGDATLFGSAATLVRSSALLRLDLRRDAPLGMLAMGSRTPRRFHPGQGSELLTFLADVVEITMRGWLDGR